MRSDARFDRDAGNRLTGTLTSPNVNVPDQNGRPPAFSSSGSTFFRAALGSAFLLLSQRLDALREYAVERRRLRLSFGRLQSRRVPLRLLLDELHHAFAILVFVFRRIELALQHLDELLRHRQLLLCRCRARRFRQLVGENHFIRIAQRKQEQVIADCAQRARVVLVAHHPMRDPFTLFMLERVHECEVLFFVAVWSKVIRSLVPLLADLRLRHKLDNLDIARRRRLEFLEILGGKNHVLAGFDLVTLFNFFRRHFLARIGIDHVLLHAFLLTIIEHVKTHGAILHRGVEFYRHSVGAEFQYTFPNRACCRARARHLPPRSTPTSWSTSVLSRATRQVSCSC